MIQKPTNHINVYDVSQVKALLERAETQQVLQARIQGDVALELLSDSQERGVVYKVLSKAGTSVICFPLDADQEKTLQRVEAVTTYLHSLVKVDVPNTIYYDRTPERPPLAIHSWVSGEPLTTERYDCMDKSERREVAHDIALFLTEMHATDRAEAIRLCGNLEDGILESPVWFRGDTRKRVSSLPQNVLGSRVYSETRVVLSGFEELSISETDIVLAHGDIHGFNLAMRSHSGSFKLRGVFDFGNTGLLDLNEEFFRLNFISGDLVNLVLECYRAESAGRGLIQPQPERISLYWKGFLLYLMEENYRAGESERLMMYRQFFENYVETSIGDST